MPLTDMLGDTVEVLVFSTSGNDELGNPVGSWTVDHSESGRVSRLTEEQTVGGDPILTRRRVVYLSDATTVARTNRIRWNGSDWTITSVEPVFARSSIHHYRAIIEEVV